MSEPAIELKDVCVNFGLLSVLQNVNLRLDTGDSLVLIGPSGCGKTVLLKTIIGLHEPASGSISIFGQSVTPLRKAMTEKLDLTHSPFKGSLFL